MLLCVQIIAWVFVDALVRGFSINNFGAAIRLTFVLWLLNIILWPFVSKLTLKISVYTFGVFNLVLTGLFIWFAAGLVSGVYVANLRSTILASVVLTTINIIAGAFISVVNSGTFYREALKRRVQKGKVRNYPGTVFLEIDGLAYRVLKRALDKGLLPHLKNMTESTHTVKSWETDYSCQTGASQLGLLHGNNKNIPAFRWVDKKTGNIVTSSSTKDTPLIEKKHSNGNGLLAFNGAARANMYSGDADDAIFVSSVLQDRSKIYNTSFYGFFSDPYNLTRTLVYFIWEILIEFSAFLRQKYNRVTPRLDFSHRGGIYPIVRGFTNVIIRDVTVYALINDLFEGKKDAIYLTFFGYDEVAHHSGVEDSDTLGHLKKLDKEIGQIVKLSKKALRPYNFVILSDHGQSKGPTFKQRYGFTLEDLVKQNIDLDISVSSNLSTNEDTSAIGTFSKGISSQKSGLISKAALKIGKTLGKDSSDKMVETLSKKSAVVLASGNLGLIYFTHFKQRLTLEDLNKNFPRIVPALTNHKGVGFIVVNSKDGGVVIGKEGKVYIESGRVVGKNPLANFRPNALQHIKRSNSFDNAPDIFVNSFYDEKKDEVAAFEELIGSHGGMGGDQAHPFIIYPKQFAYPKNTVVGAENLHKVLKSWLHTN
jgi:putative membrane protein